MLNLPRGDQQLAPWLHALLVGMVAWVAWQFTHNVAGMVAIVTGMSRVMGDVVRRASRKPTTTLDLERTRVLDAQIALEEAIHHCVNDLAALQGRFDSMWLRAREIDPAMTELRRITQEITGGLRLIQQDVEDMVSRVRRLRTTVGMANGEHER
jgi:hypothetical protein